jgi:tetratricopeptide (TPR) repeat protein
MLTDRYGLKISTSSETARDAYVEGVDLLFSGNLGPAQAFERAIAADPNFALAHAGRARALQLRGDMPPAREAMAQANATAKNLPEREASHMAFYNLVLAGQGDAAVTAAKVHLKNFPRDAMVLSPCTSVFGLIGFSGRAGREREQVELMDSLAPHYGDDWWFNCQHAFALDETGQRDVARKKIEHAMAQYPRNAHGAHIRAHVYYEDGEQAAALTYLRDWFPGYPAAAQLHCHLSWHLALCELQAGHEETAWKLYAENIRPGAAWGPPLNALTDAVAFLWRAELADGKRDPARWQEVADYAHRMFPHAGIAFADTHIALADAVTGNTTALETRIKELHDLQREGRLPSGPVVPALATAFAAFQRQDWNAAIAAIEPVFAEHERIGGSRAQRDLVEFTLLKAYINAGRQEDIRRYLAARRSGASCIGVAGLPASVH